MMSTMAKLEINILIGVNCLEMNQMKPSEVRFNTKQLIISVYKKMTVIMLKWVMNVIRNRLDSVPLSSCRLEFCKVEFTVVLCRYSIPSDENSLEIPLGLVLV